MADIIGHPWMNGEIATREAVQHEFARRHETCKAKRNAAQVTSTKQTANTSGKKKIRRSIQIKENVYMSGEPTEEESKTEYTKIVLKECDPEFSKPTAFFTDLPTEELLTELIAYLEESDTQFELSNNASKISYKKAR